MAGLAVVLDTNVLLSGLAFPASVPGRLIAAWRFGALVVVAALRLGWAQTLPLGVTQDARRAGRRTGWPNAHKPAFGFSGVGRLASVASPAVARGGAWWWAAWTPSQPQKSTPP
jgi:hypothetical protein